MSLKQGKVFYIDSLGTTKTMQSIALQKWKEFAKHRAILKNIDFTSFDTSAHALQNDGYNCGIFVCYFFNLLLTEQYPKISEHVSLETILAFRSKLAERFKSLNDAKQVNLYNKKSMKISSDNDSSIQQISE